MESDKQLQSKTFKNHNKEEMLKYLLKYGPMSRAELALKLNLTKPTISKNAFELLEEKYILEIGKGSNTLGKKSILLDINKDVEHFIIINLAGNIFSLYAYNMKNEKLFGLNMNIPDCDKLLEILRDKVSTMENRPLLKKCILSIPAVVHEESIDTNINSYQNIYTCISNFCKEEEIELIVENDIDLQGEYILDSLGNKEEDFILVGANFGIGSSIFIGGKLIRGRNKLFGEIGMLNPLVVNNQIENLEKRCSFGGMVSMYQEKTGILLSEEDFKKEVICGNQIINKYIDNMIEELSMAFYNMMVVLDIGNILLIGTLFDLREDIFEKIENNIKKISDRDTYIYKNTKLAKSIDGALLVARREILNFK